MTIVTSCSNPINKLHSRMLTILCAESPCPGAHDAAGGRLSFMAGLTLPTPCPPMVLQGGVVQKEDTEQTDNAHITWPHKGRLRQVLKPEAAQAILVRRFRAQSLPEIAGSLSSPYLISPVCTSMFLSWQVGKHNAMHEFNEPH
eukprot:1161608-Pelagomonas_calceolata.AAC.5